MNAAKPKPAHALVVKHWGADAPQWVLTLAAYCDKESQAAAARKIGRSAALVNQVLKNCYTGDLKATQARVESAFSTKAVDCPVMGKICGSDCLAHQKAPYNSANHVAVRLYVACRKCPKNLRNKGGDDAE